MADCFAALDDTAPQRFARLADLSGIRFGRPEVQDRLDRLLVPAGQTELAALGDGTEQVLGLWLRTPEPVDWPRVTATLKVRHVEGASGCPAGYADRNPLLLDLDILPSPDFASAFLAGRFAGDRIYLPRGEYELTLRFDPAAPGLPRLYPAAVVGPAPETVVWRFIQPFGLNWPLPAGAGDWHINMMVVKQSHFVSNPHLWNAISVRWRRRRRRPSVRGSACGRGKSPGRQSNGTASGGDGHENLSERHRLDRPGSRGQPPALDPAGGPDGGGRACGALPRPDPGAARAGCRPTSSSSGARRAPPCKASPIPRRCGPRRATSGRPRSSSP
ncbi:MAG: hypothetical protein WDN06_01830 [Asticcacaulis sp.]